MPTGPDAAYARLNALMVERYPDLAEVLADPAAFMTTMRERFAEQRARTPDTPHAFDFSGLGRPALAAMQREVQTKVSDLRDLRQSIVRQAGNILGRLKWWRRGAIAELDVALAFLADVDTALTEHTSPNATVTYQRTLQLTNAVTAALHFRGLDELSTSERFFLWFDRRLQGFREVSVREQHERFKRGDFRLFEHRSPVKGFEAAQDPFSAAVYDLDRLELIGLPITRDIGIDILLRLLPFHIYPVGVTRKPISADGFVRPSIDFLLHDIRHSTAIFAKRKVYEAEHGLTPDAARRLVTLMDAWGAELLDRVYALEDKEFRAAVELLAFNNHHDRGFVFAPSSYRAAKVDRIPRLLYIMLRLSGQRAGFGDYRRRLQAAHEWLRAYFLPKLPEEQALWATTSDTP